MPTRERRHAQAAAAAAREMAVLERSELVVRGDDGKATGLTANGLQMVERLAMRGGSQNYIATKLGLTHGTFRKWLGRAEDETESRLAYERGRAQHEQDIINRLLAHGIKNPISLIFYSKAKLAWRENEPAPMQQNNISLVLPQPMSREQYYKSLGIEGPVDTRITHDVTPKVPALPTPTQGD
jgi:hypothetical protein